jgi:hypothetical protein
MQIGILDGGKTGAAAARLVARSGHGAGVSGRALTHRHARDLVREHSA